VDGEASLRQSLRRRNGYDDDGESAAVRHSNDMNESVKVIVTSAVDVDQTSETMRFVKEAARAAREELGWIPWQAVLEKARRSQLAVARCNDDLVGFVLHSDQPPIAKIWQIWMRKDARRIQYGTALVNHVAMRARGQQAPTMRAKCASDLEAVSFWSMIGFDVSTIVHGGEKRNREIVVFDRESSVITLPGGVDLRQ
jgi:GNAT superfamily N-acetyltransferase